MDKKRICIVTNYSSTTNFGALLQAYALNSVITHMGYVAEDLYISSSLKFTKRKLIYQITHLQFRELKNEILDRIQKYRVRSHLKARKNAMDEFRFSIPHSEKYTKDNLEGLQEKYNVFICGSDQIFRPNKRTGELERHFFLEMVNNGAVKASYAASMGIESYDFNVENQAAEYLASFNKISMREASATEYMKKITGRQDIITSIDPVFLLTQEEWLKLSKPYNIGEQYIFVYMIHGTEKLFSSIKQFSSENRLKIITFPSMSYKRKKYEIGFADIEIFDADPLQFISLINNAEYIFTDSFHGTAFSLILHKQAFVSKANEIAFSRIKNIISIMNAEKMIIPSEGLNSESYIVKPELDWKKVDLAIKEQRVQSIKYLREVIES